MKARGYSEADITATQNSINAYNALPFVDQRIGYDFRHVTMLGVPLQFEQAINGGGVVNPNGYVGLSLAQLNKYPDFKPQEDFSQYSKRTGITDRRVITAKWMEEKAKADLTPAEIAKKFPPEVLNDPFVSYFISKAWVDTTNTEIANSVASLALSYIDKASNFIQPILDNIPGFDLAGQAFSLAKKGLDALSKTWGINPDQSNEGIATRIADSLIVAKRTALYLESQIKKTMTPEQYQIFIDSFKNKPIPGAGIKLKPLKSYRINEL